MITHENIEMFLERVLSLQDEHELAKCLKVWNTDSSEWEEIAMSLFESELLYPLSQVVEYIRQGRQIDDYIDHIELIKTPEMIKREVIFNYLRDFQLRNSEAVQRVLCAIYKNGDVWDTLDSALKGNNLKAFEDGMGSDDRSVDLKKIACHYQAIIESKIPIYCKYESPYLVECNDAEYVSLSLEEQKSIAKDLLLLCAKLMLTSKEESYLKQICKKPVIENDLSFEAMRYYYRVRDKRAISPKTNEESPAEPQTQLQDYYTKQEVIKLLNVSNTTLYNWNIDSTLQHHKIGRKVYYLKSDIEKAMNKKK